MFKRIKNLPKAISFAGKAALGPIDPSAQSLWHTRRVFSDLRTDISTRKQTLWGRHYFNRRTGSFYALIFISFVILWTSLVAVLQATYMEQLSYWNVFITLVNMTNLISFFNTWTNKCAEYSSESKLWTLYAGEPVLIKLDPNDPIEHIKNIRLWLFENVNADDYMIFDHQHWHWDLEYLEREDSVLHRSILAHNHWPAEFDRQYGVILRKRDDCVLFKLVFGGVRLTHKRQLGLR